MSISLKEVRHVARLARLQLDEAEVLALQGELNALIGHFADIQAIDMSGLESQTHPMTLRNVWSEDRARNGLDRGQALKNSALTKAGLFVVPTIIED